VDAGAPGELADGFGGAVEDRGRFRVRVAEQVVQDERRPLQRGQRLQHHQQGHGHVLGAEHLWVNPDCGLKTRGWDEIERQLGDMVAAAREMRSGA
jgi:hypothetical protein